MDQILPSIQSLLLEYIANNQFLTQDLSIGGTVVHVPTTFRYYPGDEALLISYPTGLTEKVVIKEITDWNIVTLKNPVTAAWTVANNSSLLKATSWLPLKRILLGDNRQIPDFPTITLEPNNEKNEWFTLRSTEHEYRMTIRIYVMADDFEATTVLLPKMARQIREVLMNHIHPVINGKSYPLTADLMFGQTVASIADTSDMAIGLPIYIQDAKSRIMSEELQVRTVLGPTQIEMDGPVNRDYLMARQAELIASQRYIYDSRPSDINYGYVPGKAGLMKAAEIQWFGKEVIRRHGIEAS